MNGQDSGTLPPQLSTPSTCVSGSVRSCFPFIFGSNSSSKFASYQRYLILAILTIYSHDFPRENLLLSGKGTFSCMSFTFAPLVGVEYFRAFFGRERCVLCFCALKKITSGHPLNTPPKFDRIVDLVKWREKQKQRERSERNKAKDAKEDDAP